MKLFLIYFLFVLVRSSSTEPPSGGDPEPIYIEKDGRSRGYGDACSSSNITMDSIGTTSKQRRDKINYKAQQDEEEERGKIFISYFHSI
jgi:hypothetical protein